MIPRRLISSSCLLLLCLISSAQKVEKVPFGDFENWTVRHIEESAILGGQTKTLYNPGPSQTIDANAPYDYANTIWASSNAYAVVAGVTKTSCSVSPDKGPSGRCAKLETVFASCKVAGLVNIKVLASGSLYWGKMLEPVTGVSDPYAFMDWGIPFTRKPSALLLDYKSVIPASGRLVKGTTFRTSYYDGEDPAQVFLILQHRWEDKDGRIHAKRVGTAWLMISSTTAEWITDQRIPVIYGDARKSASYKPYMALLDGDSSLYSVNSKGKTKPIIEEWGTASDTVTHAVLMVSSGSRGAFKGELGNILWVDNIRLEYE